MTLEPRLKLTVLEDDRFVFGDAEMRLLEAIAQAGTLREGAMALGLSYRVAWGKLRDFEAAIGDRLVERTVGGSRGGSTRLTDSALRLVDQYARYRDAVGEFALLEFTRIFGEPADCTNLICASQGELTGMPQSPRHVPDTSTNGASTESL